jgi:hypothetical protein
MARRPSLSKPRGARPGLISLGLAHFVLTFNGATARGRQQQLNFSSSRSRRFPLKFGGWSGSRKRFGQGLKQLFDVNNTFACKLCLIMGLVSISGFFIDLAFVALPLQPFEASWQLEVVQMLADRSLVLLLGLALLAFALQDNLYLKKPFSRLCLMSGVIFLLLCILVFQSVLSLRETAQASISQQKNQALEQIQAIQTNPQLEAPAITPEQVANATQQINQQTDTIRRNTLRSLYRTLFVSTGNLVVAGLGAIAMSRLLVRGID